MRPEPLAGTRRASQVCAGCRHARIRHAEHGTGRCLGTNWLPVTGPDGRQHATPHPCPCGHFTEPEG